MFRKTFPVGLLQCNCTILADEKSLQAVVIDPGDEAPRIVEELAQMSLKVVALIHTHAHIDHIGATAALSRSTQAASFLHPDDFFLHAMAAEQAAMLGLPPPETAAISSPLRDQEHIACGDLQIGIIHTPGHTPGSVCFEVVGHDLCFSGDTLFKSGVGRTDLWGGDFDTLKNSLQQRLYTLNGAVQIIPGHGPATTIDHERRANPFVRALS